MVRAKYGSGNLQHGDISHHAARSGSRFLFGDLDHVLDPNNHYGNPLEYETVTESSAMLWVSFLITVINHPGASLSPAKTQPQRK